MSGKLFSDDESDGDVAFEETDYAKNYDDLRRKEELLKLKNKYGEKPTNSSDSSSSDDEEPVLSDDFEKDFFKTLSCLKNKDPRIYDKRTSFFDQDFDRSSSSRPKRVKEESMTIRDYNRRIILNEHNKIDTISHENVSSSPSYAQEQKQIKSVFQKIINDDNEEDNGSNIGGLFSEKKKTEIEKVEEEKNYKEWLQGNSKKFDNDCDKSELKPLRDYWSDPNLDENEAFLRDYIINQRFKDHKPSNKIPSYEEIVNDSNDNVSEDEKLLDQQEEFEHKFNFRFEEPDEEYIKRYPRTLEHSVRRKSDKRAKKRVEVKERKAAEKRKKKEEITRLKLLKLKEIKEKIHHIKEITGNDQLAFDPEDIEGDFDPDVYDRRMHEIFDEDYYKNDIDVKKPRFPDIDEELDLENWDNWKSDELHEENYENLHCEDEDFNMDCDYNPGFSSKNLLEELKDSVDGRTRKRKKRRGKFAEALLNKKPKFDPEKLNKTFSQYIDEYYKLDCEDIVGDLPCRFKYREVPACNYGLTPEEILLADDKELNRWYPLKKTLQYRPDHMQKNDQKMCKTKANNIALKMKILPSLFKKDELDSIAQNEDENLSKKIKNKKHKKKKSLNKKEKSLNDIEIIDINDKNNLDNSPDIKESVQEIHTDEVTISEKNFTKQYSRENKVKLDGKKKCKQFKDSGIFGKQNNVVEVSKSTKRKHENDEFESIEMNEHNVQKKKRQKKKHGNNEGDVKVHTEQSITSMIPNTLLDHSTGGREKKNEKSKSMNSTLKNKNKKIKAHIRKDSNNYHIKNKDEKQNHIENITDERLKAYGLNPKKYRSFMKFKKY